jgi:peptidoglycan hydrolase CwlO-like protein
MVKVRIVAATVAVAIGGLVATGTAVAGKPADNPAKNKAAICKRWDAMIEKKQNAGNRLEKVAAKVQARIDSGKLTPEQTARAQKHLARLNALIAKLDKRVDRLQAAYDKHCTTTS